MPLSMFFSKVYLCSLGPDSSWANAQGHWHWEGFSQWGPGRTEFLKAEPARSRLTIVVMSQGCSDTVYLSGCCWTLLISAVSITLCSEKWISQENWKLCSPVIPLKEPGLYGFQNKGFVQVFSLITTQPGALEGHSGATAGSASGLWFG